MNKYYGNTITKREAIEIFGENQEVTQCISDEGKKVILIHFGELYGNNSIRNIHSAKTGRYLTKVKIQGVKPLKNAVGRIYVAD